MANRPSLLSHVLVWLVVPAVEIYLALGGELRHAWWQFGVELLAFAVLGAAQWRWAENHWLGTLLCPGLLVILVALATKAPAEPLARIFYIAGVALLTTSLLKDRSQRLRVSVPVAVTAAIVCTLAASAIDLGSQLRDTDARFGNQGASTLGEWTAQITWPLREPAGPVPGPGGPSILLVSVDTLRADAAREMESFRWLAERGAWWPSAMSTSSWTLPAVASMHTGLMPAGHGAGCLYDSQCQGIESEVPTLAEELAGVGYRTTAITANPWIAPATGLARGFQRFSDFATLSPIRLTFALYPVGPHPQDAITLVDAALKAIESSPDESSLLWLHLIDPHMPYLNTPGMEALNVRVFRGNMAVSPDKREIIRKGYRNEVEHADRELMRLFLHLETSGFLDRGVVVFTSDHGEEFWEHGDVEHGHSHHAEVVEVPLVIAGAGIEPGERSGVVSLTDIAPTIRAIAGLDARGQDLRSALSTDRIARAHGVMVGPLLRSARDSSTRTIASGDPAFETLDVRSYDLSDDPEEHHPRLGPGVGRVAEAALEIRSPEAGERVELDSEALRALGYIE